MAIGIIAITSRGMGADSCVRTVDWAIKHQKHIQAVDLADGELLYPMKDFIKPILKAKDAGLKVTIHSGEDTPAEYVIETIKNFKPDRIGHGIHSIEDPKAVEMIIEKGITLEVNPWSNFLTNSTSSIEAHPLKKLFDLGVKVTINSDDPEVLETNVNNEYRIAHEILGMSMDEIKTCNRFAFQASFIDEVLRFGQNGCRRDSFNGARSHFVPAADGLSNPQHPYGFVVDRIKAFNEAVCKQCPGITRKREHFFGKFFDWNGHLGKDTCLNRSIQDYQCYRANVLLFLIGHDLEARYYKDRATSTRSKTSIWSPGFTSL